MNNCLHRSFRALFLEGERFCAYPATGVPDALWDRYPVRGGRRMARTLKLMAGLGLDRLIMRRAVDPNPAFSQMVGESCGVAYAWPAKSRSVGRYYAYVFDKMTGEIKAYVKFATAEDDRASLRQEVDALEWLSGRELPFSIAHVIRKGEADNALFAEFELLPSVGDNVTWSADSWKYEIEPLCSSFAKGTRRTLDGGSALALDWVARLRRNCRGAAWRTFERSLAGGMPVCATHGDLACHNFRKSNGRWWIFDWENLTENGPELTDELTVEMCTRVFQQGRNFNAAWHDYLVRRHDGKLNARLVQAMAYVVSTRNSLWREYSQVLEEGIL